MIRWLFIKFKLVLFKIKWKRKNSHNYTTVVNLFPIEKVIVGKKTYGPLNISTFGNPREKLIIGSYCSIAADVRFLLGGEHSYKGLSTYPFKKYICGLDENTPTKGPIIVKDDVWIGHGSIILSGVTIGQGAVIAAGSIVTKDIPPYAIYAGGKVIKYRFSVDIINRLVKLNFEKLNDEIVKNNIDFFYTNLDSDMLESDLVKSLLEQENE